MDIFREQWNRFSESAFGGRLHAWCPLWLLVFSSLLLRMSNGWAKKRYNEGGGGKAFEGNLVVGSARTTHTTKLQSTVVPTLYTLAVRSEGPWRIWVG